MEAVYALALAPGLPAFQGHFPGSPILPGVVQVDWAMRLGEAAFGPLEPFRGLDHLKFLAPIRPLQSLELTLELRPGRLAFRYQCGPERMASGTLLLGPP
jgi:3-hydroxymyristoyl/3-hydroxydecanoyl-(acyl carrier protein) dehydratase